MARYRGPRLRIIRRLGELPGLTTKITKRTSLPGQHGAAAKKPSQYGIRLQEKQKLRYHYGVKESQLMRYVKQAKRVRGSTGEVLLQLLEMRLDNMIFRLGMAPTIQAARQLVSHGHILVNGQKVDIPSFQCKTRDTISVRQKKQSQELVKRNLDQKSANSEYRIPPHLSFNETNLVATVNTMVSRDWVGLQLNELLVVEFYSRKL
uniref:Small ribosomal subunit protein uS4c n=1 Tax=Marsupiomonas sp. NIES 1824 TaxID=1562198 RepID=A0A097KLY9_9CHLO|nr:ribosomal protein S4 [Marsupiomonas sp. NIES 1824]